MGTYMAIGTPGMGRFHSVPQKDYGNEMLVTPPFENDLFFVKQWGDRVG
jgi:hypothetical protein